MILPQELRYGSVYTLKELCYFTGFEKNRLLYWLNKFCDEGFLKHNDRGFYEMKESGKRIYDQYKRYQNKQLVRIENMHVTYYVYNGIKKLQNKIHWKKGGLGTRVYTSKIQNHTVRLIKSKNDPYKLEVYVTKILDVSYVEAYHQARVEADTVANYIEYSFGCSMSQGWVSMEPEIAIPSPIASAILTKYGVSQIKTDKGIMNRSKERGADWEVTDLQLAQKIVDMPDTLESLLDTVNELKSKLDKMPYSEHSGWWFV